VFEDRPDRRDELAGWAGIEMRQRDRHVILSRPARGARA
jgi:hypothetical protein